jgi:hypothetical protein
MFYEGVAHKSAGQKDGHAHFISVLEEVQDILRPNMPAVPVTLQGSGDMPVKNAAASIFQHLPLEEGSDSAEPQKSVRETPTVPKKFTSDLGENDEEAMIAAAYFYCDLHRIRQSINDLWWQYERGEIDLVSVSLTTNTSIDLVRNLYQEFEAEFGTRSRLKDVSCLLCAMRQASEHENDVRQFGTCLLSLRLIIENFLGDWIINSPDYVPVVAPEHMKFRPGQSLDPTTPADDVENVQALRGIMSVLPEYLVLLEKTDGIEAEHNIVRGLRDSIQQRSVPPWLAFALQLHLDVRRILRTRVYRGFFELQTGGSYILSTIERVSAAGALPGSWRSSNSKDKDLMAIHDFVHNWTRADFVASIRRKVYADDAPSDSYPDHYLLRRDPLLCGLVLYNFQIRMHYYSIMTVNLWPCIKATVHLYNCLKQNVLKGRFWSDLEVLLATQGQRNIFVGEAPKNMEACEKNYWLANGGSIAVLQSNRKIPQSMNKKGKDLEILVKTLWWFTHRYCDNNNRFNVTPDGLEKTLRASSPDGVSKSNTGEYLDVREVLLALADTLRREVKMMDFDYFQLHLVCLDTMRYLAKWLGPKVPAWKAVSTHEGDLPALVLHILSFAARPGYKEPERGDLLFEAGRIVSETMDEQEMLRGEYYSYP